MNAVRPVFLKPIDEPTQDLNMGEGQEQYNTLPLTSVVRADSVHGGKYFVSVSRWRLTDDERKAIYHGEADIVHQVVHTIGAYPPMHLQVCEQDENPVVVAK